MQGVRASKLLYPYKNYIQKLKRVGATKQTVPAIYKSIKSSASPEPVVAIRGRRTSGRVNHTFIKHQLIMFFTFREFDFSW